VQLVDDRLILSASDLINHAESLSSEMPCKSHVS